MVVQFRAISLEIIHTPPTKTDSAHHVCVCVCVRARACTCAHVNVYMHAHTFIYLHACKQYNQRKIDYQLERGAWEPFEGGHLREVGLKLRAYLQ